jgi:hypothetical protein
MATSDKLPEVPWSFLAERVSENKLVNASLKRKTAIPLLHLLWESAQGAAQSI